MFADVIVDISVEALDRTFQYRVPEEMKDRVSLGCRVKIPFGRADREISGFVIGLSDEAKWPVEKIKSLTAIDENEIPVEGQLLKLAAWIREYYGATMNEALKTVLPVKKQIKSVEEHWLTFAVSREQAERERDRCRLRHFRAKERLLAGMLEEGGEMTTRLAAKKYNATKTVVDGLVKQGILLVTDRRRYRNPFQTEPDTSDAIVLNDQQRKVAEHFCRQYRQGIRGTYLLYGVTGSGKTEVYMEMIRQALLLGQQVIVLIPEIALTYQTVKRFQRQFGDRVSVLNSRMSDGERYDQYERAKKGEIDIIVGPRSALFIPFAHLGLIIMDEPTLGIDPEGIREFRELLGELKEEGKTILISSHILGELSKISTGYGIIKDGELIEQITREELEEKCQDYFRIEVQDVQRALVMIQETFPDVQAEVSDARSIRLYGVRDGSEVNQMLIENRVSVYESGFHHMDLEEYFLERMGKEGGC